MQLRRYVSLLGGDCHCECVVFPGTRHPSLCPLNWRLHIRFRGAGVKSARMQRSVLFTSSRLCAVTSVRVKNVSFGWSLSMRGISWRAACVLVPPGWSQHQKFQGAGVKSARRQRSVLFTSRRLCAVTSVRVKHVSFGWSLSMRRNTGRAACVLVPTGEESTSKVSRCRCKICQERGYH